MRPQPVTIDSLPKTVHEQYARDQAGLDRIFLENERIAPHSQIASTSALLVSKWEELFGLDNKSTSWAGFNPPPGYESQSNRFFAHCVVPDLYPTEEDSLQEQNAKQVSYLHRLLDSKSRKKSSKQEFMHLTALLTKDGSKGMVEFDQESKIICSLFNVIEKINEMISHVNGRKTQYQKS